MTIFDQLSSLNTSRTSWKVMVRLTRMWPSISSNSESNDGLKGYNLILLDDNNCHVQAYVYADKWKKIEKDMVEGGLYIITNFYTREALGTLRPTNSKIIINFSNSTMVERLEEDDFMIPLHKFEFIDLSELFKIATDNGNVDNPIFSTDIIGVVEEFERVKKIQTMYGLRDIVKFRITDGRYSHKVSVWANLALEVDDMYSKTLEEPIIAIVTSTKMKIFKSSVQLSTLPSSKVYFNLDHDLVHAMRHRLEREGYKGPENENVENTPTPVKSSPVIETLTLQELGEKTNLDDNKKLFLCAVKITELEETGNWWYNSCTDCEDEVLELDGKIKCLRCPRTIPVAAKKFRIVVLAQDATKTYNVVLMDRAAKRLVRKTASKLLSENKVCESTIHYPKILTDIAGKEVTCKIEINDENVLIKSKIFTATDAYDDSAGSSSNYTADTGFSISSTGDNMIELSNSGDTPSTSKSTSKKMKTEV